jgi:very-short-patch-repair endonuclease
VRGLSSQLTPAVRLRVFYEMLRQEQIVTPVPEFRFSETRKWRFDFAFPAHRVAVEVEGGVFTRGRHTRPIGYLKDLEKYSHAAALGWRLIRCTPQQLATPETVALIKRALAYSAPLPIEP